MKNRFNKKIKAKKKNGENDSDDDTPLAPHYFDENMERKINESQAAIESIIKNKEDQDLESDNIHSDKVNHDSAQVHNKNKEDDIKPSISDKLKSKSPNLDRVNNYEEEIHHMYFKKGENCKIFNTSTRPLISNNVDNIQYSYLYKTINEINFHDPLIRLYNNNLFDNFYINNDNFKLFTYEDYDHVYDDQFCKVKSIVKHHIQGRDEYRSPTDSMKNDLKTNKLKNISHVSTLDDPVYKSTFIKILIDKYEDVPFRNEIVLYASYGIKNIKETLNIYKEFKFKVKYWKFDLNSLMYNVLVADLINIPDYIRVEFDKDIENQYENFKLDGHKIYFENSDKIEHKETEISVNIIAYETYTNTNIGYHILNFNYSITKKENELKKEFEKSELKLLKSIKEIESKEYGLILILQYLYIDNSAPYLPSDIKLENPLMRLECYDYKGNPSKSKVILDKPNRFLFTFHKNQLYLNYDLNYYQTNFYNYFNPFNINENYIKIKIQCVSDNYKSYQQLITLPIKLNSRFKQDEELMKEDLSETHSSESKSTQPQPKPNDSCGLSCLGSKCAPHCQTICKKNVCRPKCDLATPKCVRKCYTPKCSLECPKVLDYFALKRGVFPKCKISCHQPICKLECHMAQPKCYNHCLESDCNLRCSTTHCTQPLCRLFCNHHATMECCDCKNLNDWEVKTCCACNTKYQFKLHDCKYSNVKEFREEKDCSLVDSN